MNPSEIDYYDDADERIHSETFSNFNLLSKYDQEYNDFMNSIMRAHKMDDSFEFKEFKKELFCRQNLENESLQSPPIIKTENLDDSTNASFIKPRQNPLEKTILIKGSYFPENQNQDIAFDNKGQFRFNVGQESYHDLMRVGLEYLSSILGHENDSDTKSSSINKSRVIRIDNIYKISFDDVIMPVVFSYNGPDGQETTRESTTLTPYLFRHYYPEVQLKRPISNNFDLLSGQPELLDSVIVAFHPIPTIDNINIPDTESIITNLQSNTITVTPDPMVLFNASRPQFAIDFS